MSRGLPLKGATAELQQAVQGLYDAVVMPETWPAALHAFARATDSVGCLFFPQNQTEAIVHLPVSPDIQEFIQTFVSEGWLDQDVRAIRSWPLVAAGKVILTDDDVSTAEERKRSAYFHEFHSRWLLPNWGAIAFAANGGLWGMPLLRSERQGPISKAQARMLATAAPHLGRIVELAKLVDRRRIADHLELLHQSGRAGVLVDWRGNVSGLTPAAEAMLGSDLSVCKGRLMAREPNSNASLQRLIAATADGATDAAAGTIVAIARPRRRPIFVRAVPLAGVLGDVFGQARGLLLLDDLEDNKRPAAELLRGLFGLTHAEARLLVEMASGDAVELAADRLEIGKGTARNQLKSAYHKVGVHKHSELVALLSRLPSQ
jgi:DNA-binding CsgD family transcriptional regulator